MGLENTAKGYDYQDLLSALIVSNSFFLDEDKNAISFIFDKKDESKNDKVDDLKICFKNKQYNFQIKYSDSRQLASSDFKKNGDLSLSQLFEYFRKKQNNQSFFFMLKWKEPNPDDEITKLLIECKNIVKPLSSNFGKAYLFNTLKIKEIKNVFFKDIKVVDSELLDFLSRINIFLDTLNSSLDFDKPDCLENKILEKCIELGAGVYPNNDLSVKDFALRIIETIHFKRAQKDDHKLSCSDFLHKAGIISIPSNFNNSFQINNSIYIERKKPVCKILQRAKDKEITIVTGEPGSGKSYLISNLLNELDLQKIRYCKHYLYTGDLSDTNSIDINNLVANLIDQIYQNYNFSRTTFACNAETLNELLGQIKENFLIIIDGIDHAFRKYNNENGGDKLVELLKMIKTNDFVHILIFTQPISSLSCFQKDTITISRWDKGEIKDLSLKFNLELTDQEITNIYLKSRGNPLYATYMFKSVIDGIDINDVPDYDGDIVKYYEYLLTGVNDFDRCIYFGLLKFEITLDDFKSISNIGNTALEKLIKKIFPVLHFDSMNIYFRVYHESFIRFIFEKCKADNINESEYLIKIVNWLETLNFYSDIRAYKNLFSYYIRTENYTKCLSYCNFDFISQSLKYCYPVSDVKENIRFFMDAAVNLKSTVEIYNVYLLNKFVEINHDNIFYGLDDQNYFELFYKIYGYEEYKKIFLKNENYSTNTRQKIDNILLLNKQIIQTKYHFKQRNRFDTNFELENHILDLINNSHTYLNIPDNFSFYEIDLLVNNLLKCGRMDLIENTNNKIAMLFANSLSLKNKYKIGMKKFSFVFDKNFTKEHYAERLLIFITYIDSHLTNKNVEKEISTRCEWSFYFSIFNFIRKNKLAYSKYKNGGTLKFFEKSIVNNMKEFIYLAKRNQYGEPRSFDFTDSLFKSIFIKQILLPLTYLKNRAAEYFKLVIELTSELSGYVRGYHFACLSLEDLIHEIRYFIKDFYVDEIFKALYAQINDKSNKEIYLYGAQYRFLLANSFYSYKQQECIALFNEAINFISKYGDHKDIFMDDVIDAFKTMCLVDKDNLYKYSPTLVNMCVSLYNVTDGKDTTYFLKDIFVIISDIDYQYAIKLIINFQERNGRHWAIIEAIAYIIENHYKKIDIDLLYYLVVDYKCSSISDDVILYLLKNISFLGEENAYSILDLVRNEDGTCSMLKKNILKVNKIIKENKLSYSYAKQPRIKHLKRNNLQENNMIFDRSYLKAHYIDQFSIESIVNFILNEKFDDKIEFDFFNFLYENKYSSNIRTICDLLSKNIGNDKKSIYFCAVIFLLDNNGYGKCFINFKYYEIGYKLDKNIFNKYLFKLIKSCEICFWGFSGMMEAERIVGNINDVMSMWDAIYNNISMRLSITKNYVVCIEKPLKKERINSLFSKLYLSSIFDDEATESLILDYCEDIKTKNKPFLLASQKYCLKACKKLDDIF